MINIYILFVLLLSIFPLYFSSNFGASSMATGILIFSIFVYMGTFRYWGQILKIKKKFLFLIMLFLLYSTFIMLIENNFLNSKAYFSFLALLFVFGAAYLTAYSIYSINDIVLYNIIRNIFIIFMLFGLYHIMFIGGAHSPFPFSEASHYALFFGPFSIAFHILTQNKFIKLFIILFLLFAGVLFPNTTILVYAFLIFLCYIKFNTKSIVLFSIGSIIFIYLIYNNEYFYQHVFFASEQSSSNLSSLVYLQGVQDAYFSFVSTYGFGLGFQQLGTQQPSEAGLTIQYLMGNNTGLNRQDGGFTAAKIIAELGYFGFFLLSLFFVAVKKAHRYLSFYANSEVVNPALVVSYSFIYAYLVELFVRGAGYFTQSSFLFYIGIAYLLIRKKNETSHNPQ